MNKLKIGANDVKAGLVFDSEYYNLLKILFAKAKYHIFANIFIIDITTGKKQLPFVTELVHLLSKAIKRGVDVRIIIGGSNKNLVIREMAESAKLLFRKKNIPCKVIADKILNQKKKRLSLSHKKLVIVDEYVLLGSHNWSQGAFSNQIQDSVILSDKRFANYFASTFKHDWSNFYKR